MKYCEETGILMYVDAQKHYEELEEKTIEIEKLKNTIIDYEEEIDEIRRIVLSKNTNEVIINALKRKFK